MNGFRGGLVLTDFEQAVLDQLGRIAAALDQIASAQVQLLELRIAEVDGQRHEVTGEQGDVPPMVARTLDDPELPGG